MAADLRERVLKASVELVAEAGPSGLSMREVARRAGVSHQAPYHYFVDKESILAALVETGSRMLAERLEAAAAAGGSVFERLARVGEAYVAFALAEPAYFRLMFRRDLVDLNRFPAAEAAGARAFGVLKSLVDQKLGPHATPAEKRAETSLNWSMVHGLASLLLDGPLGERFPDAESRRRHVEQVLDLFVKHFG